LSQEEAAELLGMCARSFRRYLARYEADGEAGLLDRRLEHCSARGAPVDEVLALQEQYRARLADYKERMLALKRRIRSAFYYPAFVAFVALGIIVLVLAFNPALFSFGRNWFLALALPIGAVWGFFRVWKMSPDLRKRIDPLLLELPIFTFACDNLTRMVTLFGRRLSSA
jgi:transcriptional regulator with XRE-family HTH domain